MSESKENPLKPLKWYKDLNDLKSRREAGAFIVEGEKAIRQIAENHPDEIVELVTQEEPPEEFRRYPVRTVTRQQFLSISSARTPQGIMAVVRLPEAAYSDSLPDEAGKKIFYLEDTQDPGNTGTLIRTAAAFDFSGAILTEKCADPFSPRCVQSTAGSVLSLWLRRSCRASEMAQSLKAQGYTLVAADLDGDAEPSILYGRENVLLALGNEAAGLSESILALADYRVRLPVAAEKAESLNVAACGAIFMYLISA